MAPARLVCFALACAAGAASAALPTIKLGACGYFGSTSRIYHLMDYAAKVALEDGFFDDVVANRNFSVDINAVNTGCSGGMAAEVAPPLLFGTGSTPGRISSSVESDPVVGISGCGCSSATKVTATFANPFSVTVVSGAATSPDLGVKSDFPYFARTISPDSSQGYGLARLVIYYGWKRVVVVYPVSAYAEAVAANFKDALAAGDPSVAIFQEPLPDQPLNGGAEAAAYDYSLVEQVAKKVASLFPQPRIFMSPGNERAMGPILRAFGEQGLVSSQTVWFLAESACASRSLLWVSDNLPSFAAASPNSSIFAEGSYDWAGLPERMSGMICLLPVSQGPRYRSQAWQDFWTGLTCDRLRAAGMPAAFHCEPLFFQDLQFVDAKIYNALIFDAMTTFFVATSDLLSAGVAAADIAGDTLRDAVFAASFEGLSGPIAFDPVGDRLSPYEIMNLQGAQLVNVGRFDGASSTITFTAPLLFANGSQEVPADRPAPCGRGEEYVGASAGCVHCAPGRYGPQEDAQCFDCASGSFQSTAGASTCEPAPKGAFVAGSGASEPTDCPPGSFTDETGATSCTECAVGYAQPAGGASVCLRCVAGTFAGRGASLCSKCPGDLTTEFPGAVSGGDCGCAAGSFAPLGGNQTCQGCKPGMLCPFGADASAFGEAGGGAPAPLLSVGHYSSPADPLSVYRCRSKEACPGGLPGTCGGGRVELACAACPEGQILRDGQCSACSGTQTALPLLVLLGMCGAAAFVYYGSNSPVRANATASLAVSVSAGIVVTSAQLLSTFLQLGMPWSGGTRSLMSSLQVFLFDTESTSAECLLGHDAVARYAVRCSIPFVILAVFAALYGLSQLAGRFRRSLAWQREKTLNSICTVFQVIFIALTAVAALPLQCYSHPNGQKSVVMYPDIICGSEGHRPLVAMGLLVLLVVVLPFVSLNIWATHKAFTVISDAANSLEGQSVHLTVFRYLFFRFRPDVFWWGAPLSLRQLLLAFAPAVAPDDVGAQIIYVVGILLAYLAATCLFWPWKSHELNLLDASSVAVLMMLMMSGSTLAPAAPPGGWMDRLTLALASWLLATGLVFVGAASYIVARSGPGADFGLQSFSSAARKGLGGDLHRLASLLAALPSEQCTQLLERMNTFDVQTLSKAISCIQGASRCEIWVSGDVFWRLNSVEHSRDGNSRSPTQWRESLKRDISSIEVGRGSIGLSRASLQSRAEDQEDAGAPPPAAPKSSGVLLGSGLPGNKASEDGGLDASAV